MNDALTLLTSGQAIYVDDIPAIEGLLYAAVGTSARANARIKSLDLSAVRNAPGVVDVLTAEDIPAVNDHGPVQQDDPVFATDHVEYVGQSLFAVVAESVRAARSAVSLARIDYEESHPVLSIEDAMAKGSFLDPVSELVRGEPDSAIQQSEHKLAGRLSTGSQDHFYLESQIAIAIPKERQTIHIISATQHPSEVQHLVARMLGIGAHSVIVECPRLGGGFGGKETQASLFACIAALASRKTNRPVKLRLRRDEDMTITGKRHDFLIDYEVGFDSDGVLRGMIMQLNIRCGRSADLSVAMSTRAILHVDNCYYLEHVQIVTRRCKTHTASNTAFRGFGGPQAILAIENVMDDIARFLQLDPLLVRRRNFYDDKRNTTHYGMRVEDNILERLVSELESRSDYTSRRQAIAAFNSEHKILKRGLALTPVKYGISFAQTHLNQAGALVHVYTDGTVMLNHGGTEMGQGLHAKVVHIVANELGVSEHLIRNTPPDTSKVPNTSPTAASASSDLNGKAAQLAARKIRKRLMSYISDHYAVAMETIVFKEDHIKIGERQIPFKQIVHEAYMARINLSATGHYRTPKIHFNPETMQGRPFFYFVYGAAVSEVLVDTLTGETRLERVDILQDAGRSLNPEIDRGQIEGAFIQGVGWLTTEELYWNESGTLETTGPATYKIPTSYDWPKRADIHIVDWSENREDTILRSKGIGEPPLMLASSVFIAIKDAIASLGNGNTIPQLNAPATPEEVLRTIQKVSRYEQTPQR